MGRAGLHGTIADDRARSYNVQATPPGRAVLFGVRRAGRVVLRPAVLCRFDAQLFLPRSSP